MRDVTQEEFLDQLNKSVVYTTFGNHDNVCNRETFVHGIWDHVDSLKPEQPIVVVSQIVADFIVDAYGFLAVVSENNGLVKLGVLRPLSYFPKTGIRIHLYKSDSLDKARALVFSDNDLNPIKYTLGL